jgi:MerR HTH family regulatory protein
VSLLRYLLSVWWKGAYLEGGFKISSKYSWEALAEDLRTKCGLKEHEIEEARIAFARGIEVLRRMYCQWVANEEMRSAEKRNKGTKEPGQEIRQYSLTGAAKVLGITRQCLYYWINKKWIVPKRDYRNYPVFTVVDIQEIEKWRKTLKKGR